MSDLTPADLRCEHQHAPQGLNTRQPRFTWALQGTGRGRRQTAYRIVVGLDRGAVARGRADLWDSGKVASPETLLVPYAGRALSSGGVAHWAVQAWDENDKASPLSEPATFHVGLLDPSDWQARWVSRALVPPGGRSPPQDTAYDNPYWARPADYYRRALTIAKPVRRALIYATALGVYELQVNGEVLGDQVLAPGWTDYHTRVEYQTYDATALLREGANAIGAIVGEGWYCGRVGYDARRAAGHYGMRPTFLCQIHIDYADGTRDVVVTDGTWKTDNAAIVYSDLLLGEKYDARLEQRGWSKPGFDDAAWWSAEEIQPRPLPRIDAARGQPVRRTIELAASFVQRSPSGALIFDLGQNIAGRVRLELEAPRDAVFALRHGEALAPDGELYTANLRGALATDTYISKGGRQIFEPRFTVHGFRYVALAAPSTAPGQVRLTGIALHSDMPAAGELACGNEMVNRLVANIVWTQRDNFLSVPTDCPQRDERMGWLGDAQLFFDTAAFNMDTAGFFTKWLVDVADAQGPEGAFTDVAPAAIYTRFAPNPPRGAPGWGDAGVIIPWRFYRRYGDVDQLQQHYGGMVRWMDYIGRHNPRHLRESGLNSNWGDWLCLGTPSQKAVVATAYWAYLAEIMERVALLLGRRQDRARFAALRRDVGAAFRDAFVGTDGRIAGDTQTVYLLALDFGLLDREQRGPAVGHLRRAIERAGGHLQTGILGIRHLLPTLCDNGAVDLAYDLLLKESYPSWGFSIRHGATTIWERWDGWTPERGFQSTNMNSLNHYALGSVGEWLYARVAGIDVDDTAPGFRRIRMRPLPTDKLGWCRASFRSHLGRIASEWRMDAGKAEWSVTIPANCTAAVTLPPHLADVHAKGERFADVALDPRRGDDGSLSFDLASGEYAFVLAPLV